MAMVPFLYPMSLYVWLCNENPLLKKGNIEHRSLSVYQGKDCTVWTQVTRKEALVGRQNKHNVMKNNTKRNINEGKFDCYIVDRIVKCIETEARF